MAKIPKSHVFRGKRYNLKWLPHHKLQTKKFKEIGTVQLGYCNPPTCPGKSIYFDKSLEGFDELETYVHETHHALYWDLDEHAVRQGATDLAKLLWKLGYRKVE